MASILSILFFYLFIVYTNDIIILLVVESHDFSSLNKKLNIRSSSQYLNKCHYDERTDGKSDQQRFCLCDFKINIQGARKILPDSRVKKIFRSRTCFYHDK